jgi:hypothetical protein
MLGADGSGDPTVRRYPGILAGVLAVEPDVRSMMRRRSRRTSPMATISARHHDTRAATVAAIIDDAAFWIGGQTLLSQGRCVDVLLDLYDAVGDEFVQWCITERLSAIRFLNAVDGHEMRGDLAVIGALTLPAPAPSVDGTIIDDAIRPRAE